MQQPLPKTHPEWLHEIVSAMAEAQKSKPASDSDRQNGIEHSVCTSAAAVCLRFRGRTSRDNAAIRVVLDVIEAYFDNTDPDGVDLGLEGRPFRSFTFCYLAAHRSLGLLDEPQADAIFKFCDENLGDD